MDKLYLLVKEQFPEFVRSDYPKFVQFVQAYYKWLEENSPQDLKQIVDIDETPTEYFDYFAKQLDVYGLLNATNPYVKKYITNIKEIYTAKGTEQGLLFLLKAVYDSDVSVDHPIQYVLKPSDGKWVQEKFITLRTFFGSLDSISEWDFSYDCRCAGRNQIIDVTRVEVLDGQTIRLYYQNQVSTILFIGQRINIFNSFGAVMFTGTIVPSPSVIEVLNAGTGWQLGQVINWPGSDRNTIIRIADVNVEDGSIKRIEVVNYGYDHSDGETFIVSPYPLKPLNPSLSLTEEQISFDPPAFLFTLSVEDEMEGVTDEVRGFAAGTKFNSYFLEPYQSQVYVGNLVFNNKTFASTTPVGQTSTSLEDWSNSRASLRYKFGVTGSLRGKWIDESSHLSTDSMRLQDSFYYQQYSYVIESDVNPSVYKDLAAAVHLSGTKMFTQFNATSQFKLDSNIVVTFPFVTLDILDVVLIAEVNNANFIKARADQTILLDSNFKQVQKFASPDTTLAQDLVSKDVTKARFDTQSTSDTVPKVVDKYTNDSTESIDIVSKIADITRKSINVVSIDSRQSDVTKLQEHATGTQDSSFRSITQTSFDNTSFDDSLNTESIKDIQSGVVIVENDSKSLAKYLEDEYDTSDIAGKVTFFDAASDVSTSDTSSPSFIKVPTDSIFSTDVLRRTSDKYLQDGVLIEELVIKQSNRNAFSAVIATSLDTSSEDVNEYFESSQEYNVRSERYAEVSVFVTIPE
jgi:hypothetical protein